MFQTAMLGTVIIIALSALGTFAVAASLAEHSKSRGVAYGICLLGAFAFAGWIGLAWEIPSQPHGETFLRALAIILPSALLGVRVALGRKPTETQIPDL